MIPEYLTFIYRQDKRLLPYIYFLCAFLLFLYWKNRGYELMVDDVLSISIIYSLVLFNLIYELRDYWAYKCAIKNIDFKFFYQKSTSAIESFLAQPVVASVLCFLGCSLVVKSSLTIFSSGEAYWCVVLVVPVLIYLIFWSCRHIYVKQMRQAVAKRIKYRNLYYYTAFNVLVTFVTSSLIVSPLATHVDFSLSEGFFSARLMTAIWIVCFLVLIINMLFARPSRRYHFLGRLFLKEIDFNLSKSLPLPGLYERALWVKLVLLIFVESLWILMVSIVLSQFNWLVSFYVYFSLCILPVLGYFYLHVYWLWHHDYLAACDMYLRCGEIDKNNNLL